MAPNETAAATAMSAGDARRAANVRPDLFDVRTPTPYEIMRMRAKHHPGFLVGMSIILVVAICALFAPWIAPYNPFDQDISRRLINPIWGPNSTWDNPLGTDAFGRDYLSRLIHGARVSMIIGLVAPSIACIIGTMIGMVGGYFGGRVDAVVMYLINTKLALPGLVVTLSLVAVFGGSMFVLICVITFLFWDRYAIVLRTVTQQIRSQDFITAAEAIGCSRTRIILTEILPNVLNQMIVILTLEMALAILIEATLSFLGLGIQPPLTSLGLLLGSGRSLLLNAWWIAVLPGLVIFLTTLSMSLFGDWLRDRLDPMLTDR